MNIFARKTFKSIGLNQMLRRFCSQNASQKSRFETIMQNNKKWASNSIQKQPDFFSKLVDVQTPKYLWIGCADSRVPANQIIGLKPGQVFVHRNVANIASPSDINCLAVIQYAVEHLKVQEIIVAGHYGCGGVKAAFSENDYGALQSWLSHLRELRSKYRNNLIGSLESKIDNLVELNVMQQVVNVGKLPVVQAAWRKGKNLNVHGVVYNLADGILKDLGVTLSDVEHMPQQFRIVNKNLQQKLKQQSREARQRQLKQQNSSGRQQAQNHQTDKNSADKH